MTRARRLLLAMAAVCAAALWSVGSLHAAADHGQQRLAAAAPDAGPLGELGTEVVQDLRAATVHATTVRHSSPWLDARLLVAVVVIGLAITASRWQAPAVPPRPQLAPTHVRATHVASRAPPRPSH